MNGKYFCLYSIAFISSSTASASNIKWHPSLPLHIGSNLDLRDITAAKPPCLTYARPTSLDNSAPSTVFSGSIVRDKEQLDSLFSISASASARFGFGSASGSISRLNEVSFDSDTINWAISATSDYGKFGLIAAPSRSQYYSSYSNTAFAAECGTNYIMAERREAAIAAVFSFKTSSRRSRENLEAALNASWSGGNFSTKLREQLAKSLSTTSVKFTLIAKGGDGLSATSGLVNSFDDFDKAREQVLLYMKTMTRSKAPAAEYISAPIPGFLSEGLHSAQESALTAMWYDYKDAESVALEANNKIKNIDNFWYYDRILLRQSLRSIKQLAEDKMGQLQTISLLCKNDKTRCNLSPNTAIADVDWPSINVLTTSLNSQCNGTLCSATMNFSVRAIGPLGAGNLISSQMSVRTSQPINSNCLPLSSSSSAVVFRCILDYTRDTDSVERSQLVISNSSTGNVAFSMLLTEFYPNISK